MTDSHIDLHRKILARKPHERPLSVRIANFRFWPDRAHRSGQKNRRLGLFSHFECVIDFNTKLAHRAFELGMAKQ